MSADDKTAHVCTYRIEERVLCKITRSGRYCEIHVRSIDDDAPAFAAAASTPTNDDSKRVQSSKNDAKCGPLLVLLVDFSGSMYAPDLASPMVRVLAAVAKRHCADGGEVLLIPWAFSAAYYVLHERNIDSVLAEFKAGEERVQLCDAKRPELAWVPPATPERRFMRPAWSAGTLPRTGLALMLECLTKYRTDRNGASPESVQVLFATDGEFQTSKIVDETMLSDTFLGSLRQSILDFPAPISLVYLGIIHDHVPDARRILDAFPVSHYRFVQTADELSKCAEPDSELLLRLSETSLMRTFPLRVKQRVYNVPIDERGRGTLLLPPDSASGDDVIPAFASARCVPISTVVNIQADPMLCLRAQFAHIGVRLCALQGAYAKSSAAEETTRRTEVLAVEKLLNEFDRQIRLSSSSSSSSSSEKTWTRQLLYGMMRIKNGLQLLASAGAMVDPNVRARMLLSVNQDLKMSNVNKFSTTIAKQISRNAAKLCSWQSLTAVIALDEAKRTKFESRVKFEASSPDGAADEKQVYVDNVPRSIAEDTETEFMTADTWAELFARGDAKCHAFRLDRKPHESQLHAAAALRIQATNTQVALSSFYAAVEQHVAVNGFDALFDKPFTGITACDADKYNVALPTWGPNIELASRFRLKPLLGLIQVGHELAFTSRSAEIYVPATLALWDRALGIARSRRAAEDALLMTNAWRHIRLWLNMYRPQPNDIKFDNGLLDPKDLLAHFMSGETGAHLFVEPLEPLLLAMITTPQADNNKSNSTLATSTASAISTATAASDDFKSKVTAAPKPSSTTDVKRLDAETKKETAVAWDWSSVLRGVQREVVFGAVHLSKMQGRDAIPTFVEPIMKALMTHPVVVNWIEQNPAWCSRPATNWPQNIVVDFERIVRETPEVSRVVSVMLQSVKSQLELANKLATVGAQLPPDTFAQIDRDYCAPDRAVVVATASATAVDALSVEDVKSIGIVDDLSGIQVVDGAAWLATSIELPSNSARRDAFKMLNENPLSPLMTMFKRVLDAKLTEESVFRDIKHRYEKVELDHAAMPMLFHPNDIKMVQEMAQLSATSAQFTAAFRSKFGEQLEMSTKVWAARNNNKLSGIEMHQFIDRALTNLYLKRNDFVRHPIPLTISCLPDGVCSFLSCPMFLQPQPAGLSMHFEAHGSSLSAKHKYRHFVPRLHLTALQKYSQTVDKKSWMNAMQEYAATYVDNDQIPMYQARFEALYVLLPKFHTPLVHCRAPSQ
jgi:hypothetical protein